MAKVEKIYYYPTSVPTTTINYASYIKSELWRLINVCWYKPSFYKDIEEANYHASSSVYEKDYCQIIAQILCKENGDVIIFVDNPILQVRDTAFWEYGTTDFNFYD